MVVYDGSRYYVRPAMLGLKGPSHGIIRVSWLSEDRFIMNGDSILVAPLREES